MERGDHFYGLHGLNVETYDVLQQRHSDRGEIHALDGDVDFYVRHAVRSGGPVLELACGTGRVAWPIAEAGIEVTGIDRSEPMLDTARAKGADRPEETRRRAVFVHGDMTRFDLDRSFGLAVIAFRSFQSLLTPDDERSCLECIHRHLAPGGRLIIDNFDPLLQYCAPGADSPPITRDGVRHPVTNNKVEIGVLTRETDPFRQVLEERWRFREVDDSGAIVREEEETLRLRWIYRWEMRHLLELTRFEIEAEYSDFHGSAPAYGKEQVWVTRRI